MRKARSEVTLKFNELPEAKPAPNKKVEISLTDQNGVIFTALINAKSWRKAEADAQSFSDWGGAVSGKLGQQKDNGLQRIFVNLGNPQQHRHSAVHLETPKIGLPRFTQVSLSALK